MQNLFFNKANQKLYLLANVFHHFCCQHGLFTCIHHTPLKHDYLTLLRQQKDYNWNPECFRYQYLVPCPQILHPHADLFIEIMHVAREHSAHQQ